MRNILLGKRKNFEIASFKQRIREQEEQLFGITLFFQTLTYTWAGDKEVVEINKHHYENIIKRGKEAITKAKQLLNEVQKNPNKLGLLRRFKFPPIRGHPMLDQLTKRTEFLVKKYNELFPERPKAKPLTIEEYALLSEAVVNEYIEDEEK